MLEAAIILARSQNSRYMDFIIGGGTPAQFFSDPSEALTSTLINDYLILLSTPSTIV